MHKSIPPSALSLRHKSGRKKAYRMDGKKWEYYDPPEKCAPVEFCLDSSLHGLRYIGQKKRHTFERLLWMSAFIASVVFAGLLIYTMWTDYRTKPIVTVFTPEATPLEKIPFPSLTICSVNNMQLSKMNNYKERAEAMLALEKNNNPELNKTEMLQAYAAVYDIVNICFSMETFAQRLVSHVGQNWTTFFGKLLDVLEPRRSEFNEFINPSKLLADSSQSCRDMIMFCMWLDEVRNCSELFQEIQTDYGYCCTFNTIPLTLLYKHLYRHNLFRNFSRDSEQTVKDWEEADLSYDNLLFTEETKTRKYPFRQKYPGRSAGLTVLLDPNLKEYSCANTDSNGFVVGLHSPLDFPRMVDNGILVRTDAEIFMNVHPEITMSDSSIKKFGVEKRNCVFDTETSLPHYTKYTGSNCLNECIAYRTKMQCNCVRYYMPRDPYDDLCKPEQYNCTNAVRKNIMQEGLGQGCDGHCKPTCTEIDYHAEVTSLTIRESYTERIFKVYPQYKNKSADISILHVYFGMDCTYPRMRKEVYTVIDLISSTGGLLGLCMGFSILSLLEIIYHFTLRLCFSCRRERLEEVAQGNEENSDTVIFNQPTNTKHKWLSKVLSRPSDDTAPLNGDMNENAVFKIIRRHNSNSNFTSPMMPHYYTASFQTPFSNGYNPK